jgi:hypothetical protein
VLWTLVPARAARNALHGRDRATWHDPPVTVPPEHREFARHVADAAAVDPRPTFENLSRATGVPVADLQHYALVRWASAGADAILAMEPEALRRLIDARRREDWAAVGGIVDWLESGL